jgi:hypothetical protein
MLCIFHPERAAPDWGGLFFWNLFFGRAKESNEKKKITEKLLKSDAPN